MPRPYFRPTLALALVLAVAAAGGAADNRPNIVLIMTDDQGYGDLGITGDPVLKTPPLDALARASATMRTFMSVRCAHRPARA